MPGIFGDDFLSQALRSIQWSAGLSHRSAQ